MSGFLQWMMSRDITAGEFILNALLIVLGTAILISLIRLHRRNGKYNNFNLVYLLVNKEGYPDGAKCIEIGTFLLLSWGFIVYVVAKSLPEWYMQTFIVTFIVRGGYGAYLRSKGDPVEAEGTTVKTEAVTTVKTTEVTPPEKPKGKGK